MPDANLPIVDMSPALTGDAAARRSVGRAFGHALETTGFAVIVGHGVPEALTNELYATMKRYFAQPSEAKRRDVAPEATKARGYLPMGAESVAGTLSASTPADLCEALVFAAPHREGRSDRPNIWPSEPPALRGLVEAWIGEILTLTGHLTSLSALALDVPEDYFAPWFADPALALRFVHYPDQAQPPAPGQLRYGAHHDYGGLTLLRQDGAPGGLEIADREGRWIEASVVPNSFVINVGDLLARWTNGRWRSTLHRVSNPERSLTGSTARLSMVAFTAPNEASEVACLPTCCNADNPARYEPVVAGAYILSKIRASMTVKP